MALPNWIWIVYAPFSIVGIFAFRRYLWSCCSVTEFGPIDKCHMKKLVLFLVYEVIASSLTTAMALGHLIEGLGAILALSTQIVHACGVVWVWQYYEPRKIEETPADTKTVLGGTLT